MSGHLPISDAFLPLLNDACDGTLIETQVHELAALLHSDSEARKAYVDHMQLRRHIRSLYRVDTVCNGGLARVQATLLEASPPRCPLPPSIFLGNSIHSAVGYFSSGWPVAYLVATVIFGIGLLIGAHVYVSQPVQVANQSVSLPSPRSPLPSVVGRITGMVDCRWERKGLGIRDWGLEISDLGSGISANPQSLVSLGDRFALRSGLMEITYDTGARVILQGPMTYSVETNGGYLAVGKLTGRLEKKREGGRRKAEEAGSPKSSFPLPPSPFVVRTPTAIVTDLGTEFGVEVDTKGLTTSHVFSGLLEVQVRTDGGKPGQSVRLTKGESMRIERQSGTRVRVVRSSADPAAFVRPGELPKYIEEQRLKPFRRWQAYSQELRHDPSLLAYYDFQRKTNEPAVLPNVAASGDKSLDGVVNNATWSTGRMPGKHALQFNGPDDYVQINLPQKVNDLTLAAWINVDSFENDLSGLLMSDGWLKDGLVAWQLHTDGRMGFSIFDVRIGDTLSAPVFDGDRLRRWTHLAVVYDHAAFIRFYVDGSAMDARQITGGIPPCIGAARIGNWNPANYTAEGQVRNFRGRIDEMAIFGRALKTAEIRRMFEADKPASDHSVTTGKP